MVFVIHKKLLLSGFEFRINFINYVNSPSSLTNLELRSLFLIDLSELLIFIILKAGKDLLFHVLRQSTIGAERLDFRVRNGIGYDPFAKITGEEVISNLK